MAIELRNLSHRYPDVHHEWDALSDVSVTFNREEITAIIGPTGSGKSTLVQHLNLLLRATGGDILYDGKSIYGEHYDRKALRARVGLVFQYPEYQLFETDIYTDVCFGPRNLGLSQEEIDRKARKSLLAVGFAEEDFTRSPFELSGGQKRRAAIAGILAMAPEYLVLDEPAAGLDPRGRQELFTLIREIHREQNVGIIIVSHSMDDVAEYADKIVVLRKGRLEMQGTPHEIFARRQELLDMGLELPAAAELAHRLRTLGHPLPEGLVTMDEVRDALLSLAQG